MNTKQENFCLVGRIKMICGVMGNREERERKWLIRREFGGMRKGKRQKQRTGRVNLHP